MRHVTRRSSIENIINDSALLGIFCIFFLSPKLFPKETLSTNE